MLHSLLFPKICAKQKETEERLRTDKFELQDQLNSAKKEARKLANDLICLNNQLSKFAFLTVMGIEKAKDGSNCIVTTTHKEPDFIRTHFDIWIYVPTMGNEVICNMMPSYNIDRNSILLHDIQIREPNTSKGIGSIAMKYLFKICHQNNIKRITGGISPVDWDHIDRLEHFYKKNGFAVELDHLKKEGKIFLELN